MSISGIILLIKYKQNNVYFLPRSDITMLAAFVLVGAVLLMASGGFGFWLSYRDSQFLQGLVSLTVFYQCCHFI